MRELAMVLIFLFGNGAMENDSMDKKLQIVAHRGSSIQAPENTLAAFRLAFEDGADRIEGDFRITSDGAVVCIHDESTGRTSGNAHDLVVRDSVLAQLKHLDVGSWKSEAYEGERIPTLQEVLQVIPEGKGIVIELKGGATISRPSAEIVRNSSIDLKRVAFIAFDAETLATVKIAAPACQAWLLSSFKQDEATGAWAPTVEELIATARRIKADGLDVKANPNVLDEAFVAQVHEAGLALHVYTVDDPELARKMMEAGVDSITTNTPKCIRAKLSGRE